MEPFAVNSTRQTRVLGSILTTHARVSQRFAFGETAEYSPGFVDCDGSCRNACADRWPDNPARTASDFVQKSLALEIERVIALESR